MSKRKGFTLIELVMVIVILAVLAAVAIPKYIQLLADARIAAEKGVVGGVRAGVATFYANACKSGTCAWPAALDAATDGACVTGNACFTDVLEQGGITGGWTKAGLVYTGPNSGVYTYDPSTGSFLD